MSQRLEQVESTLQRAIATVLQRKIADPRITGLISITRVKVSPDLREAQVFVSVMPETSQSKAIYGLRHAAVHIQSLVRKQVTMRVVPHLEFKLDQSLKKQAEVFAALQEAAERTGPAPEGEPGPDAGPDPPAGG